MHLRGNWRHVVWSIWCKQCIEVQICKSANLQIQLGNAQARVQAHVHEANLSTHDRPSRAEAQASELIIYLLKSFLLFPNKEFSVSRAGS
jgi:hypothetical protein